MIFASVDNGQLTLSNHDNTKRDFSLDEKGLAALAETMKEWSVEDVMCSSSVDFAEEYGAPADLDVGDFISKAQLIAAGPPNLTFTIEQLEEMAEQLRDGEVWPVIERIERNIEMVKKSYAEAIKA